MSMRVMQVKYNSRVKNNQVNSRKLFSLNTTRSNEGGCNSTPVYQVEISGGIVISSSGPTNMCGNYGDIPIAPSHQQGYGLYLKRAKMGVGAGGGGISQQPSGGSASRVVGPAFVDPSFNRGLQQRIVTYKRPQSSEGFSSSSYIDNLRSKTLRCEYSSESLKFGDVNGCKPNPEPICFDSCGKNVTVTKDLGYLSSSQKVNKRLALRAGANVTTEYESPMMRAPQLGGNC